MRNKSVYDIEKIYAAKLISKTRELNKRYNDKKIKDRSKIDTYREERYKTDLERRKKKYLQDREKDLKNIQRIEKGHKIVVYKKKKKSNE
jgi:hypothetical protein